MWRDEKQTCQDGYTMVWLKQMGSLIKGRVKWKNTSPCKKTPIFRFTLSFRNRTALFLSLFAPVISFFWLTISYRWSASVTHRVQGDCIFKAHCYKNTAPGPSGPQKIISAMPTLIEWITDLMVVSQPLSSYRHRRIRMQKQWPHCCVGCGRSQSGHVD